VDEAHGTHFAFSKNFPINAGKYADIVINSAHKTLPTLTGGAILSVYNEKLLDKVDKAYHMFQSTSPSYLTLMSIEYGVYLLNKTPALVENLIEAMLNLKGRLIAKGLKLHKNEDVTRLVVDTEKMGISGKELDMRLQECKVFCEYSTMSEVVFIMSVFDDEKELLTLGDIILDCVSQCGQIKIEKHLFPKSKKTVMKYLDASNAETELVDIEKTAGRIASRNFGIYPPARPIAVAGEEITNEMIKYLELPLDFYGVTDNKIWVVKK
ncbi:MAG: hypothetical protein RR458_04085, partial [Clostridia bacterium]